MNYINKLLKKYKKENILKFYNELNIKDREKLVNEIKKIDFKLMNKLYINSYKDDEIDISKVSPLNIIVDELEKDKDKYINRGIKLVKNNHYGIVIMAGGNASRLGIDKSKGMLEINAYGKKVSLFQIFINKLKDIYDKYQVYINLYIMTNRDNKLEIENYFRENNYFCYSQDKIKFFAQDNLPLLDISGHILLKDKSSIWFVPNGNGNVFKSLKNSGLIKDMKKNNIKYVLFTGIDNPLTNLVDYKFIGATSENNYKLSSKTIYKSNALDLSWVFCKYNNRPYMLNDKYIEYFTNKKDNLNNYLYREKNILYHLIHIDYVDKFSKLNLPYHRAYKKYSYIDEFGNIILPDKENAFKFEQFIYDAFCYAKDMLLYRVNDSEFCPIKTKKDIKKVESILKEI